VEYDGLLCLGDVPEEISEAEIKQKLQRFGEIESCTAPVHADGIMQHRVKFTAHGAAQQAELEAPKLGVCRYAFIAYKDLPYDDLDLGGGARGW